MVAFHSRTGPMSPTGAIIHRPRDLRIPPRRSYEVLSSDQKFFDIRILSPNKELDYDIFHDKPDHEFRNGKGYHRMRIRYKPSLVTEVFYVPFGFDAYYPVGYKYIYELHEVQLTFGWLDKGTFEADKSTTIQELEGGKKLRVNLNNPTYEKTCAAQHWKTEPEIEVIYGKKVYKMAALFFPSNVSIAFYLDARYEPRSISATDRSPQGRFEFIFSLKRRGFVVSTEPSLQQ